MSRVSGKPYSVYVLWSPACRRFYIGASECVSNRLEQHNNGLSRWTSRYRPWTLVYTQQFPNYAEARKFENKLKKQKAGMGFYKETGLQPKDFRTA